MLNSFYFMNQKHWPFKILQLKCATQRKHH